MITRSLRVYSVAPRTARRCESPGLLDILHFDTVQRPCGTINSHHVVAVSCGTSARTNNERACRAKTILTRVARADRTRPAPAHRNCPILDRILRPRAPARGQKSGNESSGEPLSPQTGVAGECDATSVLNRKRVSNKLFDGLSIFNRAAPAHVYRINTHTRDYTIILCTRREKNFFRFRLLAARSTYIRKHYAGQSIVDPRG